MRIKTITVGIEETINVGNFESIKSPVALTAELDPTDDIPECHEILHKQVAQLWSKQILTELNWVRQRRAGTDKEFEFQAVSTPIKQQLIKLVK